MFHLKCTSCMIRIGGPQGAAEFCPRCGSPLEAAASLSELVGYQRWLDDGGAIGAEVAVAAALPVPEGA